MYNKEASISMVICIVILYRVSIRFDNNRFVIYTQLGSLEVRLFSSSRIVS